MKTKYILSALCLPALFAACTNDDFLNESANGSSSDASTVKLTVAATYGTGDEANTKMVNKDGTFWWENTDILGATLLGGTGNGIDDDVSSNNKFTNTLTEPSLSADFTTASTTVVGEYLFYYPYNTEITTNVKAGVKYSLPEPQEYDPDGEKMMKNNFMVSPRINLDGGESNELTLPLTMRSIYAYGTLNLTLNDIITINGGSTGNIASVNIQKITIDYTTASNVYKDGKIDMSVVPEVNLTADNLEALREGNDANYKGKTDEELTRILLQEKDAELTAQNETYSEGTPLDLTAEVDGEAIKTVTISCIDEENPNGVALAKNSTFSTRVLLPTVNSSNITIKVYTDRGVCTFDEDNTPALENAKFKASHTVNLANPNRSTSIVATALTIAELDPSASTEVNAVSVEDFIASMKQFEGKGTQTVEVTLGNFDLTPEAIAAIPENVSIELQNAASFAGDMTLKNIKLAAGATNKVKSGVVTLESVSFQSSSAFDIEGGELVVAGTAEGNQAIYNVKGGKLTVNNVAENGDAVSTNIYTINATKGSVEVNTPVAINASGSFTVAKGVTVTNNSTINTITSIAEGGKLVNNGNVTVTTNNGTIDNNVDNTADATFGYALTVTTNDAKGVINTKKNSKTVVTTNNGYVYYTSGTIINYEGKGANTEAGNIYYVVTSDTNIADIAKEFATASCTALRVEGATLTIPAFTTGSGSNVQTVWQQSDLHNLQCIVLDGAATVVNEDLTFNECSIYVYGVSTLGQVGNDGSMTFKKTTNDVITVGKDAALTVNVSITGLNTVKNYGKVTITPGNGSVTMDNEPTPKGGWAGADYTVE